MKRKKYGYAILLSVRYEQKRLPEKMALQEEEPSEEISVQAEEETVTGESEEPELIAGNRFAG